MKLVIGLVGQKGSGKGTFVQILRQLMPDKNICSIKSSKILGDTLNIWDIPFTVENLQKLAVLMENGYGRGILSNVMEKRIENIDADIVIFDGVRWETDVEIVRNFSESAILYVTASPAVRYSRTVIRNEKIGDIKKTFQEFMEEEAVQTESTISMIGDLADFKIVNEDSVEKLIDEVRYFIDIVILPKYTSAT